ncbi:MAG: hypothetical protein JXB47_01050 [Anaerolineae bacterium]|nr:hypothetical protein [Anaerolineae bacterium]
MEDTGVLIVNGFLYVAYFLSARLLTLVALGVGLFIAWRYDREVIQRVGGRTRRYGRGEMLAAAAIPRWHSSLAIAAWSAASLIAPTAIEPAIGAALWLAFLAGLVAIPAERSAVLFRCKMLIVGYAALVLVFRLIMGVDLSGGAALAAVTGQMPSDANELFTSVKWSILPYLALMTWVIYPAGFIIALWQRYQIVRPGMAARGRHEDVIGAIVTRGEGAAHDAPPPPRAGSTEGR